MEDASCAAMEDSALLSIGGGQPVNVLTTDISLFVTSHIDRENFSQLKPSEIFHCINETKKKQENLSSFIIIYDF